MLNLLGLLNLKLKCSVFRIQRHRHFISAVYSVSVSDSHSDKQSGTTLIVVLFLIAMLQWLAIAVVEKSILDIRMMRNRLNRVKALHAADAALLLCSRRLEVGSAPFRQWIGDGEPAYWRMRNAFDGPTPAAFELVNSWPYAIRPPQCLIERWPYVSQPDTAAYLITARGFGHTLDAQAWVQSISVNTHPGEQATWRHTWRPIVARPY